MCVCVYTSTYLDLRTYQDLAGRCRYTIAMTKTADNNKAQKKKVEKIPATKQADNNKRCRCRCNEREGNEACRCFEPGEARGRCVFNEGHGRVPNHMCAACYAWLHSDAPGAFGEMHAPYYLKANLFKPS